MGEDRRKNDRRVGSFDRRIDSSNEFQGSTYSNNSTKTVSLTTFIVTVVILFIITVGIIGLVYINLNNKMEPVVNYYNEYLDESLYTESDFDSDIDSDIDYDIDYDTDSDITETTNNS